MRLTARKLLMSAVMLGGAAMLATAQEPPAKLPDATKPGATVPTKPVDPKAPAAKDDAKKAPPKEDALPNVTQNANTNTNNQNNDNNNQNNNNDNSSASSASLPAVYGDLGSLGTYMPYLVATTPNGMATAVRPGQTATFPIGTKFSQPVSTQIVTVQTGTKQVFDPQTETFVTVPVFERRLQVTGGAAQSNRGGVPVNIIRGSFKIGENESPRPLDRFYYAYHFFNDVNQGISVPELPVQNVHRHTLGMEKVFLDGDASIGLRLPFLRVTGAPDIAGDSVGDISVIFKYALYNEMIQTGSGPATPGDILSAGLVVTAPTGGNVSYSALSPKVHSTFIQPWIGGTRIRGNVFGQFFSSIAVPTDSYDAVYWFNSIQMGYKLYEAPTGGSPLLRSVTPVLECHFNTPLNHREIRNLPVGAVDVISFTGGTTFGVGQSSMLNLGANVPVTGPKPYAVEAIAQFNFYW